LGIAQPFSPPLKQTKPKKPSANIKTRNLGLVREGIPTQKNTLGIVAVTIGNKHAIAEVPLLPIAA